MRKILLILLLISATAQAQWFPTINSQVPLLNNNNTFTGTNTFKKIIADTVTINNIARANSTYWINGTDTLGWVDAARSDVVFFPQMRIGNLQSNTTVAQTYIRSNQVQTDTLYPHSPLIIMSDTTIAHKIFANYIKSSDSIRTKNIYADTMSIKGNPIIAGWAGNQNIISLLQLAINSCLYIGNYSLIQIGNASDHSAFILRDNDFTIGIRNGLNPQNVNVYNNYSNASNYNRLKFGWTADSIATIKVENAGQFTARPLRIYQGLFDTAPSSASDTGTAGEIRFCADALYICTATNTWRKAVISTW